MKFLLYMTVTALVTGLAVGETIFVPAGGDIQAAIDQSSSGDVIQLEAGVYPTQVTIRPNGRAIVIRGVKGGDGNESVIDAGGFRRVIECTSGEGENTRFENLRIIGGDAEDGGGMLCNFGSSPTIINCEFTGNISTSHGGGLSCRANSNPVLLNCRFEQNESQVGGGGVFCDSSDPFFLDCVFKENVSRDGGGFCLFGSASVFTDCHFEANSVTEAGGAGAVVFGAHDLVNCVFVGNVAFDGGALHLWESSMNLADCTVRENTAKASGGGLYIDDSNLSLSGCEVCGNLPGQVFGPWEDGGNNVVSPICPVCNDADDDGVCDENDQCPGEPDVDSDADGTVDCLDGCPDDALKIEPGRCGCGVIDTPVQGDFDCDGDFDLDDHAAMGNALEICPGDMNGDGQVDGQDLGLLFAAWGTCF